MFVEFGCRVLVLMRTVCRVSNARVTLYESSQNAGRRG